MTITKLIELILALFRKQPPPVVSAPLTIPHPEEEMLLGLKISEVNIPALRENYYSAYFVPLSSREELSKVKINIENQNYYPAYSAGMTITINPQWANAGVLAHEMAHIIYFQYLKEEFILNFAQEYNNLLTTDPLMILLDSQNSYMNTSIVEAYAEVYRYLGEKMPSALKKYYPLLFKEGE